MLALVAIGQVMVGTRTPQKMGGKNSNVEELPNI